MANTQQELSMQRAGEFDRVRFKFVDAKPGEKIDFTFNYSGEVPIWGITKSCGCVANFDISADKITGTYDVGNNFRNHSGNDIVDVQQSFTVFFDDEIDYTIVRDGVIMTNPEKPRVILSIDGQVKIK